MKKTGLILIIIIITLGVFLIFYNVINKKENVKTKTDKTTKITSTTKRKEENLMYGITLNYHASIKIEKNDKVIYFDPFKIDNSLNDADYVFITHSHYDHYSEQDIKKVKKDDTKFIVTSDLESKISSISVTSENITVLYHLITLIKRIIKNHIIGLGITLILMELSII